WQPPLNPGKEEYLVHHDLFAARIEVLQVFPDCSTPIQILGDLHITVTKPISPPRECPAHFSGKALFYLFHHVADDATGFIQDLSLQMPAKGEQHLEQIEIRL